MIGFVCFLCVSFFVFLSVPVFLSFSVEVMYVNFIFSIYLAQREREGGRKGERK